MDDRSLGELLQQRGLVSRPQLAEAWAASQAARQAGRATSLGEVLVANGSLRREDLEAAVADALASTVVGSQAQAPTVVGSQAQAPTVVGLPAPTAAGSQAREASGRSRLGAPGSVVGPYTILEKLGEGGMGEVLKAWDPRMNREVALKRIRGDLDRDTLLRFEREARLAGKLRHPGIAAIYELVTKGPGAPYLAMDYVPGTALIDRCRKEPFAPGEAARVALGVCEAIEHAHELGVLHRDLKPHNVILTPAGRPVVLDFGLAKQQGAASQGLTKTGQMLGTVAYMAPEQVDDARSAGPPADVYGLGALLYECLCGSPPFTGSSQINVLTAVLSKPPPPPRSLRPDVHRDLETICLKCLEKDPADRYPSVAELAADLRRFLDHQPITARPSPPLARLWRRVRRHRALVLASCLTLVGGGVGLAVVRSREQAHEETAAERDALRRGMEASARFAKVLRVRYQPLRDLDAEASLAARANDDAEAVIAELGELIEAAPRLPELHVIQGTCYAELGRLGAADACAERALALDATHAPAWRLKGQTVVTFLARQAASPRMRLQGRAGATTDTALAMSCFAKAREHGEALPPLADAWDAVVRDDLERAVALLDALEDRGEADEQTHYARATAALLQEDDAEAAAQLDAALAICPRLPEALFARGLLQVDNGRLEAGFRDLDLLVTLLPTLTAVYFERGAALVNAGQPEAALAEFQRAVALEPDDADGAFGLGVTYQRLDDFEAALRHLDQAILLAPDYHQAYRERGLTHKRMGRLDAALADLDRAVAGSPDVDSFVLRAEVRAARGDPEGAIADWSRALELEPRAQVYSDRASLHRQQREYAAAVHDAEAALALDPDRARTWGLLALAKRDLGDLAGAVEAHQRAVTLAPEDSDLLTNAAIALFDARQPQRALELADRALEQAPDEVNALFTRARTQAVLNRPQQALADYDAVVALAPDDHQARVNRGNLRRRLGDLPGALADHDHAVACGAQDFRSWWNRGKTRAHLGDPAGAAADYDEAIRRAPDTAALYVERGDLRSEEDLDQALADYERAIELDPDHVYARVGRARLWLGQSREADALGELDWALERTPQDFRLWDLRGKIKRRLDDDEGAAHDAEESLRLQPNQPQAGGMRRFVEEQLGRPSRY